MSSSSSFICAIAIWSKQKLERNLNSSVPLCLRGFFLSSEIRVPSVFHPWLKSLFSFSIRGQKSPRRGFKHPTILPFPICTFVKYKRNFSPSPHRKLVKKLLVTCSALFAIVAPIFAHEVDMDNTQGLFGFKPEYIHTLINPLPTYGLIIGIAVLFIGLLIRNIATRNTGLIIILFCSGITWVVIHYGNHGYNHLYMDLDPESKKWADIHMDRAESFAWAFYATAIVSIIALAKRKTCRTPKPIPSTPTTKTQPNPTATTSSPATPTATTPIPRTLSPVATWLAVIALIFAIISFALGSWISRAGGRIRHTEFREGPAPTNAAAEHEHHHN